MLRCTRGRGRLPPGSFEDDGDRASSSGKTPATKANGARTRWSFTPTGRKSTLNEDDSYRGALRAWHDDLRQPGTLSGSQAVRPAGGGRVAVRRLCAAGAGTARARRESD